MRLIICLFVFLFSNLIDIYTQNISVEFSIEWEKKLNFSFKELNNNIHPALLNITYRNISNEPLYCLKIADGKACLPEIISLNWDNPLKNPFPTHDDKYFKRRYFIGFKNTPKYYDSSWDIRNDTTDIEYKILMERWKRPVYDIGEASNEDTGELVYTPSYGFIESNIVPSDWLFMDLDQIYNYIYWHYYSDSRKAEQDNNKQFWYYPSDITQDTIMNNSIDKFVFLKPGETYVDKYNLIGFQITGGSFTFQLDDTKSLDYVEMEPDKNENGVYKIPYPTKQLPKKVGEYELFTGEFLTNQVSVQFPGIR